MKRNDWSVKDILNQLLKIVVDGILTKSIKSIDESGELIEGLKNLKFYQKPDEYIICAAIWVKNEIVYLEQPVNITTGYVVAGHRHGDCYMAISNCRNESYKISEYGKVEEGFLTNTNKFLTRTESFKIAKQANQLTDYIECNRENLNSEHLY